MSSSTSKASYIVAVYPGSFDPLTFGHADIIQRASKLVSKLIVAIGKNSNKQPCLSVTERIGIIEQYISSLGLNNVEVKGFEGLLVDFAEQCQANVIVRGLRALSDFDFEFNLASTNNMLNPKIENLFLMASGKNQFISSRLVREVFALGGDVSQFVPSVVQEVLERVNCSSSLNN